MWQNKGMKSPLYILRVVGFVAATTATILYLMFVFFNPYGNEFLSGETYILVAVLISLACLSGWASLMNKPLFMLIVSVLSFIPVGFYLLLTPGIFKYIGFCNLICIGIAILMRFLAHSATTPSPKHL
ncbi:MAG TPA: hypothetical protein VE262_19030 [Blastocatellia bacterium]|nr:hypothetical protein [Blastocatellia bacterium]